MIPKVIYYCWFGGSELSGLHKDCISTWKKNLKGYEIIRLSNSDLDMSDRVVQKLYSNRQWAFISDYMRMKILYEKGGIYLDVDMEVIQDLSPLLVENDLFIGEELENRPNTAILGSVKGHVFLKESINIIEEAVLNDKPYKIAPEVAIEAINRCKKLGLSESKFSVYDREYFYPYNPYDKNSRRNNLMYSDIKENTYTIHHWTKSWNQSLSQRILKKVSKYNVFK